MRFFQDLTDRQNANDLILPNVLRIAPMQTSRSHNHDRPEGRARDAGALITALFHGDDDEILVLDARNALHVELIGTWYVTRLSPRHQRIENNAEQLPSKTSEFYCKDSPIIVLPSEGR